MSANKLLYLPRVKILWKEGDMHDSLMCTYAHVNKYTLWVSTHLQSSVYLAPLPAKECSGAFVRYSIMFLALTALVSGLEMERAENRR